MKRRKLIERAEIAELLATCYSVEGSGRLVLELHMFGPAYASHYLLLRSKTVLDDPDIVVDLGREPSRFGKTLVFGRDLERDTLSGDVYLIEADGPAAE